MYKVYLHHSIVFFIKSIQLFDVLRKVLKLLPCGMEHGAVFNAHSGLSYIGKGKESKTRVGVVLREKGRLTLRGILLLLKYNIFFLGEPTIRSWPHVGGELLL